MSEEGDRAVSVIGFIGSVFSPWYRWSGRKNPEDHCCINVATYGRNGRFTMTDRGRAALRQSEDELRVGPSRMYWTGRQLIVEVEEISAMPHVSRVRGTITLTPSALTNVELALTPSGSHVWRPFAPTAEIEVNLTQGHVWKGHGYFDANFGTAALEDDFHFWTWGRFPTARGATVYYDGVRADDSTFALGIEVDRDGSVRMIDELPPQAHFARSGWFVRRDTRADGGFRPRQVLSMLDAPFYSRALVETQIGTERTVGVHEALDLRRFASPLLKPMIAVRVPRRPGWRWPDDQG
ncbi:carotenoid 1,2-hydratase [Phaeovulum vinaykumarii]|uniref:Hydroxyneurosporene synthase n=1 Tax=Phaeovulum vinaykumarii TaxID=407234 RepID=A0A1N7K3D4_9RHOB|nr:carotenoid 1,2-hydratase [Phaeovulum vinaykumarii]SIS56058.1 hydroxyneurosporene synthase [Phaeovulum vinaykumarii]SOB92693.1 hydroxyneurosporene synthase [Phaeovulum vinaykumarii]